MSLHRSCVFLLLFLCSILPNPIYGKCDVFGVNPDNCDKYSDKFFYCGGDKERALPLKYVNDDYCDCVESNDDEPGTSACNHGRFWCENIGYRGRYIYSSLVNDGLCDCCDGLDEINNDRVQCANTCKQKAEEELQGIIQQRKKYMEGIKVKNSLLQIAKSKINEKQNRKQEIQNDLDAKRAQLKEKEDIKKIAEQKEKEYKEEKNRKKEEERAKKEEERRRQCEAEGRENCDQIETKKNETQTETDEIETDSPDDVHEDSDEETPREQRSRERRERREERRARRKAERETRTQGKEKEMEKQFETENENEAKEEEKHHEHTPDEEFPYPEQYRPHDEIETENTKGEVDDSHEWLDTMDEEFPYPEQYRPHEDGEDEGDDGFDWSQYDEDEDEEMYEIMRDTEQPELEETEEEHDDVLDELSNNDKKRGIFGGIVDGISNSINYVKHLMFGDDDDDTFDINNPFSKDVGDAKREYNDLKREIKNLESDLSDIEKVLGTDFGDKNVYASLLDDCYSIKIGKYEYEFCPFANAKQKEGGSSTDLGSFKSFGANDKGDIVMVFEGGQKCWNGPKRSMAVSFKCDTEHEIAAVSEPSTCKYGMAFHSPLACKQEELDKFTDLIQNQFKTEL